MHVFTSRGVRVFEVVRVRKIVEVCVIRVGDDHDGEVAKHRALDDGEWRVSDELMLVDDVTCREMTS